MNINHKIYCFRFRSITKQYFRKADGVVIMYDVNSEATYTNVRNWMESVQVCSDFTYIKINYSNQGIGGIREIKGYGPLFFVCTQP